MATQPIRFYSSDDRRALAGAAKDIQEILDREIELVAMGNNGCETFDAYQRRCGKIEGLRQALDIFREKTEEKRQD